MFTMGLIGTGVKKLSGRSRPLSKKTAFLGLKLAMDMVDERKDNTI